MSGIKEQVRTIVENSFEGDGFERYWNGEWRYLQGRTPEQAIADGDGEKVIEAAHAFVDGAYL